METALSVRDLIKKFGDFAAVNGLTFDVEDGKFFSILGPSGCGKTTLLRTIAGFYEPTSGELEIRGKDMLGVEPNKRPVNLVFQHLALFPMMNVQENIAFGLKRRGESGKDVTRKVDDMLERVGLPGFGKKKVTQLSGGQKQRVAIARCLVLDPTVLLLDEPLGALDAKLREHMKVELKKLQVQVGSTFVYITHDQSEAMVMSDYVAVMNSGRFEQIGTPQELYHEPKSSFVAQFVGSNNKLSSRVHKDENGRFFARYKDGKDYLLEGSCSLEGGDEYDMFIRPEAIVINPSGDRQDFNIMNCEVKAILFDGGNSRLLVIPEECSDELIVSLPQNRQFDHIKRGDSIRIGWSPAAAVCFRKVDLKIYDDV
jgi:spermidine/putrescine transport system ATP-binding protein